MKSTNHIFKSIETQRLFELDGFVVVDLVDEYLLDQHINSTLLDKLKPSGTFYSSSFSDDEGFKDQIDSEINLLLKPVLKDLLFDHKSLGTSILIKSQGSEGKMEPHQDWTVVDESEFSSVTIWIPLEDVDATNGALSVIRGSHKLSSMVRSPFFENPLSEINDLLINDLELIKLKRGQAIIFNHALIHSSGVNYSTNDRVALTYGFTPKEAQLIFYTKDGQYIDKYVVPDYFFKDYNTSIGQKPSIGDVVDRLNFNEDNKFILRKDYFNFKVQKSIQMKSQQKSKALFKSSKDQDFFDKNGFIKLPLLKAAQIDELTKYYNHLALKDENGFGFHVSMDSVDEERGREVRDYVWSVVIPELNHHLENFKPYVASYVVKEVNPKGVVPAHQDWSFVDNENEGYSSITCWIPLVDTSLENGCIGAIKGSHHFFNNYRPSPSPQTPVPLSSHMFSIFPYLTTIEMKAGEVLLFDNRTFHASLPNTSNGVRLAVGVGITQADSTLVHYYLKPDGLKNTLLKYNVDEDFFLRYNNSRLSKLYDSGAFINDYKLVGEISYNLTQLSSNELVEMIQGSGNQYNDPMCERLQLLYGDDVLKSFESNDYDNSDVDQITDTRNFFEKYSPTNIYNEILNRIKRN